VQLQPDGTLYASGLGLLDAAGKVLHQPNSCAISVADSQRDFAFGSCGGNTWGLFHVSDGSPVWPTIFLPDSSSFSWLCTLSNGKLVMSLCAKHEDGCIPLILDPTALEYAPSLLPDFDHGHSILQAFQTTGSTASFFVIISVSSDNLGYVLDVGKMASGIPALLLSQSFDVVAAPYAAALDDFLYVTGYRKSRPRLIKYDLSNAQSVSMWDIPLDDEYGGASYSSLAVDSSGTVYASGSKGGGLYAFSSDGVLLLQAPGFYNSVAMGPDGSLYAFSNNAVQAYLSPTASSAPPAWHLYAELGAGALGALLLAGLLARWFWGRWCCCCCFRGCSGGGGDDYDGYIGSSSSAGAQGGEYEFYEEPMLLIKDSAPSSPFSLGSLFSGSGSLQETTFKASAGSSVFGGGDSFGTTFRSSGNPWGSSSGGGSGSGSSGASNPF